MRRNSLKILIYGAGRVGGTLYYTLKKRGVEAFRYSRGKKGAGYLSLDRILKSIDSFDLVILSVPDMNIEVVVNELYRSIDRVSNRVILHTSGTISYRVLDPLIEKGFITGSLHPYFSFYRIRRDVNLEDICFGLSCEKNSLKRIEGLFNKIGINYEFILDEKRVPYHISAVFVSNFTALLLRIAFELLEYSGFRDKREDFIFSLLNSTLYNLKRFGIEKTITGPAIRGDMRVLNIHKGFLKGYNRLYLRLYTLVSNLIMTLYK